MNIELEQYRLARLPCDELGVMAAFLKLPCVYGVSGSWIKKGYGSLEERIHVIAGELERKGLILAEPGGVVRMDRTLYELITAMGRPIRLCRVSWGSGNGPVRLYLYRVQEGVIAVEQDGRGGCHLGRISVKEELVRALSEPQELSDIQEASFGGAKSWLGALVFEKKDNFYERILDLAWSREPGLADGWDRICRVLWDGAEE